MGSHLFFYTCKVCSQWCRQHGETMSDRLQLLDPTAYPSYFVIIWAIAFAAGAGVCFYTPLFRRIEILATLAHETGHGLGGLLAGRRFNSFTLHPDASGVTYTTGAGRLGLAFCFWSGYAAPGTVAALLVAVVAAGVPNWAFLIAAIIMAVCLIRARSALTLILVLGTAGVSVLIWWVQIPLLQTTIPVLLAGFFLLAGFRQIGDAWRQRNDDGGEADGDALEGITKIPEVVWLLLFHLHTAICTALAVGLVVLTAISLR